MRIFGIIRELLKNRDFISELKKFDGFDQVWIGLVVDKKSRSHDILLKQNARWALFHEAEEIIVNEEFVYMPLWQRHYKVVMRKELKGLSHNPFEPIMIYREMYLSK